MARYTPPPAFPLQWPEGRARTSAHQRQHAKFECTLAKARDGLGAEIVRLGGHYPVISSNLELRLDGLPRGNQSQPDDPAVAVYFEYKGKGMCFACDRWHRVEHNIRAIEKTIEAMRGIERWGTGEMLDRAINAFQAIAGPEAKTWRTVLGLTGRPHPDEVRARWKELAARHHPDKGGDPSRMAEINAARDEALRELAS